MKNAWTRVAIFVVFGAGIALGQIQQVTRPKLTTNEISAAEVIGSLGVPLGVCVPIKATMTRNDSNTKASQGKFYLKVTHVNDRELPRPLICGFYRHRFATDSVKLANDDFSLYELRYGRKAGSLTGDQVRELEQGYVGTPVELIVYQTGGFRGMPLDVPKGVGTWQDYGFGFQTELIVMDQLQQAKAQLPVQKSADK